MSTNKLSVFKVFDFDFSKVKSNTVIFLFPSTCSVKSCVAWLVMFAAVFEITPALTVLSPSIVSVLLAALTVLSPVIVSFLEPEFSVLTSLTFTVFVPNVSRETLALRSFSAVTFSVDLLAVAVLLPLTVSL